jgi:hypothetical protein
VVGTTAVIGDRAGGHLLDPELLAVVRDALAGFDESVFDPLSVLHVHVTDTTLGQGNGVVRVESLGPVVLGQVRDWLTHPMGPHQIQQQIHLRPVLDAAAIRPVDAYEHPGRMSELATVRTPYEVFPYGTRASRCCENDHVRPFRRAGDRPDRHRAAPPGQTRLDNNAKLAKRHHRIKTFGGWQLHHPEPGVYLWRTRHGHWLRVDPAGTHHLGRDAVLDATYTVNPSPHRSDRRTVVSRKRRTLYRGATMADKSPRQHMSKKAGKSLKEKRAEKHAKAATSKTEIISQGKKR